MQVDLIIAVVFLMLFIFILADYGNLSPLETLLWGCVGVGVFLLIIAGTVLLGVFL